MINLEKKRINTDVIGELFTKEEIEARKKEILEKHELRRKQDFEAKELMKQERQELKDKGFTSSKVGQELRIMEDVDDVIKEVLEIEPEEKPMVELVKEILDSADAINETAEVEIPPEPEPEPEPTEEELAEIEKEKKRAELLAQLKALE